MRGAKKTLKQSRGDKNMRKTILITGSTDGIGLETAKILVSLRHKVLLHGRNPAKLGKVEKTLSALPEGGRVESYVSDLSRMAGARLDVAMESRAAQSTDRRVQRPPDRRDRARREVGRAVSGHVRARAARCRGSRARGA